MQKSNQLVVIENYDGTFFCYPIDDVDEAIKAFIIETGMPHNYVVERAMRISLSASFSIKSFLLR